VSDVKSKIFFNCLFTRILCETFKQDFILDSGFDNGTFILIYFEMSFIPVIKAEFSASLLFRNHFNMMIYSSRKKNLLSTNVEYSCDANFSLGL